MCRLLHSNRSPSRQVFTRPQKGSTFHSGRWWTAVSPGDELAEVEGQPVQPAREGGRGGEGRSGRGWPGEVSWAILPKARAMQYHQKPEEKKPPLQLQLTGPCHRTSCSNLCPCVWALNYRHHAPVLGAPLQLILIPFHYWRSPRPRESG